MPELPEVSLMVDRLQPYVGRRINLSIVDERVRHLDRYLPHQEHAETDGQRITGVFRRGKHMVFALERGALLCHNAMSGYWDAAEDPWCFDYVEGSRKARETDVRVQLLLSPNEPVKTAKPVTLRFHDARKFGSLRYVTPEQLAEKLSKLGPDALKTPTLYEPTAVMTEEQFAATFAAGAASRHPIKAALMEQDKIAGVGNIYAAEACWSAGIDPRRLGMNIGLPDRRTLFTSVQAVLQAAIDRRLDYGQLCIYRRKVCNCGARVESAKLCGRTTYWCPACQA